MNGDIHLAYQVVGEGAATTASPAVPDLVYVPSWIGQVEHLWAEPRIASFFERLASFTRLIMFDRRGTGMSDRISTPVPLEEQMDDIAAVMDAAGSEQAAVFAQLEGGAMASLFAATHPDRVRALVLYATMPRFSPAPEYEWPPTREEREAAVPNMVETWGNGDRLEALAPSSAGDPALRDWFARLERLAVPPGSVPLFQEMTGSTDVRDVLPIIQAPTLVLHRTHDSWVDVRHSRYVAEHVPGARLVELPGDDTLISLGAESDVLDEVEEFLTGARRAPEADRVLATVLFTDLVGSTERAAALGDAAWRDLLGRHDAIVRREVERFRGRAVKSLGDGWLATFDGPARAIRCALALGPALAAIGLDVRAGLHTGECELIGDDVGGLAVHIAARVMGQAGAGEVLASGTVADLVVGSGLRFAERGARELRGVPGTWRLLAVER